MSLEFAGNLYSGSQRNGLSLLVGVGHGDRYNPEGFSTLLGAGLFLNVHSVDITTSAEAEGNVILFTTAGPVEPDFQGPFLQLSAGRSGFNWWNFNWVTGSVLLVASGKQGTSETRLSFSDIFLSEWTTFLDKKLAGGRASRVGDPVLTWEMFPANVQYLDPNGTYLKIFQKLNVSLPWPYDNYAASMTYHIGLFPDANQHVRCWGQRWGCWVDSGVKSGHVADSLAPEVQSGLDELAKQVNATLQGFDGLLGKVTDVYYLPGTQTSDIATGTLAGNTADDVTIVIEH